jgi:hypothetical protein
MDEKGTYLRMGLLAIRKARVQLVRTHHPVNPSRSTPDKMQTMRTTRFKKLRIAVHTKSQTDRSY